MWQAWVAYLSDAGHGQGVRGLGYHSCEIWKQCSYAITLP